MPYIKTPELYTKPDLEELKSTISDFLAQPLISTESYRGKDVRLNTPKLLPSLSGVLELMDPGGMSSLASGLVWTKPLDPAWNKYLPKLMSKTAKLEKEYPRIGEITKEMKVYPWREDPNYIGEFVRPIRSKYPEQGRIQLYLPQSQLDERILLDTSWHEMIHGAQSYDETVKGLGRQMWFNAPYKVREEHLKHWANPNQAAEELLSYFSEILLDDVRKSSLDPKWFDIVENVYRNPDLTIMDILKDIPR